MSRRLGRNVLVLSAVSLLTDASSEMIYPLLPVFLSSVLGAGAVAVGALEGIAQAVSALMQVLSGQWSDRIARRKPLIVAGYALASVLRPLTGLATGVGQVLAIRVGDRVGKGVRGAPRDALIAASVGSEARGRAFGFHRAADHAGAVIGPLVAFALLSWWGLGLRTVFLLAAIPAALAVVVALVGIVEVPGAPRGVVRGLGQAPRGTLARYLGVLALFTLGNSTDAFLLLRAQEAGVPVAQLPLLWAFLHVVKSLAATPGGALSDRVGRRPLLLAGWGVYALVYLGFGFAATAPAIWGLMALYGVYHGLTEGTEKALVADLTGAHERGWAFGWFNLVVGISALPASLLFGALWEWRGASVAFAFGAAMAGLAALLAAISLPRRLGEACADTASR
ncbi:MAG: MFS transporter [Gemmatimonadetes bacterium]|nr:MFS transporter [Gemmatimonadota bacterium]